MRLGISGERVDAIFDREVNLNEYFQQNMLQYILLEKRIQCEYDEQECPEIDD